MNEAIDDINDDSVKEITPLIKEFHQKLRRLFIEEQDRQYQQQREIDSLNREKINIQSKIHYSHNRIKHLEKIVGIKGELLIKKPVVIDEQEYQEVMEDSDY